MAGTGSTGARPLSPHLQVWKFHATMYGSIFHRITGIGLYGGAFLIAAWLMALVTGPDAYAIVMTVVQSIPGQIILYLWAAAVLYHLANGLRHLIWDGPGVGFDPKIASLWSTLNFVFAIVGTGAIFALTQFA